MIHPFMPFISEEIWRSAHLRISPEKEPTSIMQESWPHIQEQIIDKEVESSMQILFELISTIRTMRIELEIPLQDHIAVKLYTQQPNVKEFLMGMRGHIHTLAKVSSLTIDTAYKSSPGEFVYVLNAMHVVIPLAGIVNIDRYRQKLSLRIKNCESDMRTKEKMLSDENFTTRAPVEVVAKEKERIEELKRTLTKLKVVNDGLK